MTERNVSVAALDRPAVDDQTVEIVERKGIGHPDSLCDGIAESVSRALAAAYLDRVGTILHYNTDETQLVAGNAAPAFGGGEVIEPIYILIVGRATSEYEGTTIPTEPIALRAARQDLDAHVPHLDVGTDVILDAKLGEGSGDLRDVFDDGSVPMANDTSFGVGHAPLSETEEIVLATERRLNGEYATDNPELGADIKVMGKREGDRIDVTVAAAMIDAHIESLEAYTDAVDGVREYVTDLAREHTDREVDVRVNTADDYDEGSIYLTTTGTSAEQGDDGSVGRGNRANGLITPNRSMSMEATSGKNPVNHIGKLYNLLSTEIAESVVREVEGIRDLRVRLVSRIGQPVDQPHVADIHVSTASGVALGDVESAVARIVDRELGDLTDVTRRAVDGEISTF
ncbi:S-adenosylmethionine synthetase [Halobacteriales archaeon QH_9_66_26]|nr:MAG: S-adenosylmethionine synthetase [Halobacteriales archaeon QH_9_66_26]